MNDFEKDLNRAYEKGTQDAADKKDLVWDAISRELEENKTNNSKRRKSKIGLIVAAATVLVLVLSAFTTAGQAAVARIIDLFAPEKQVETNLEGQTEEHEYQLHTPGVSQPVQTETNTIEDNPTETEMKIKMTYAMYIDGSRYSAETVDGVDWIRPLDYPADYPEVTMSIYQVVDKNPSEIAEEYEDVLSGECDTLYSPEEVEIPIPSIHIYAHGGFLEGEKSNLPQWDSPAIDIYLVDNTQGGTFVVVLKYFMEAAEGHAERLKGMLEEMTIIPVQ